MKSILFIFVCVLCSQLIHSQEYMDEIIQKTCDCVSEMPEDVDSETFTMEIGLCMINVSLPYKKQLKKDYDVDLDNVLEDGEKLGEIIGVRMAGACPDLLIALTEKSSDKFGQEIEEFNDQGNVVKIEKNQFISIFIKSENGKTNEYLWIEEIITEEDLIFEYQQLKGKTIEFNYVEKDFFDPKVNDYRKFNILKELNVVN